VLLQPVAAQQDCCACLCVVVVVVVVERGKEGMVMLDKVVPTLLSITITPLSLCEPSHSLEGLLT